MKILKKIPLNLNIQNKIRFIPQKDVKHNMKNVKSIEIFSTS